MNDYFRIIFFISFLLLTGYLTAQENEIKGKVVDNKETPLPSVSVMVKGTDKGTSTDFDGEFSIKVKEDNITNTTLVFKYLGMQTKEIKLESNSFLTVTLEDEANQLDEVVTVGYGRKEKKDVTGSISSVSGEAIRKRHAPMLDEALQGAMAGVRVTKGSNAPGSSADIKIRGVTTIGNSSPLILVDNIPVSSINDVNPSDVKEVTVLKDGASAAIYGARAAAGVILITTKRAKEGKLTFNYDFNFGIEKPTQFPEMVGVKRYMEMKNEHNWNDSGNPKGQEFPEYPKDVIENYDELHNEKPNRYPLSNWNDLMIKDYSTRSSHSLAVSGGEGRLKTRASFKYDEHNGMAHDRKYDRMLARINNDIKITDKLKASIDISFKHERNEKPNQNDPLWNANRMPKVYPAMWEDGRIAQGQSGVNPWAKLEFAGFNRTVRDKFQGKFSLEYLPVRDLSIKATVAPYLRYTRGKKFRKKVPYTDADDPDEQLGYITETTNLTEVRNNGKKLTTQILINYKKSFGDHKFDLLAGYEGFKNFTETMQTKGDKFEIDDFPYLNLAPQDELSAKGGAKENAYRSFFGRINYNYQDKYLVEANLRRDGSSRFSPYDRWGSFPSVSAGWVVTEENFVPDISFLSFLKLKGSWGQLGNERIGDYPYQATITNSTVPMYQGSEIVSRVTGAQVNYAITNISWETTEMIDFGLEASLLGNRLSLDFDYYKKETRDMLLALEIPRYTGFSNPDQNTGKMHTTGWDLELGWRDNIGDFNYSVSANLSDAKSVMGYLGGTEFKGGTKITTEGTEYNEWYGYVSDGIYQTQEEVDENPALNSNVKPGDIRYKDVSGSDGKPDGRVSPDHDKVPLGGSLPRYEYGGNINMEYKGFDFTLTFQGVGKKKSHLSSNAVRPFQSGYTNVPKFIDGNYWSLYNSDEENLNAHYPRLSKQAADDNNYKMSDYWLIDGSYFRVKNIELGYTLPSRLVNKIGLTQLRIFVSGLDLFTYDHYPKGWDPEVNTTSYISKTYLVGANIKL